MKKGIFKIKNDKCPNCGMYVMTIGTMYGIRNQCKKCNLHSWGDKPVVSQEVHDLRKRFHKVFDPLWRNYGLNRDESYIMLSEISGYEESECHGATQDDILILEDLVKFSLELRKKWKPKNEK